MCLCVCVWVQTNAGYTHDCKQSESCCILHTFAVGSRPHGFAHGSRSPWQHPPGGDPTAAAEQRSRSQYPQPGERPASSPAAERTPGRAGELAVTSALCSALGYSV